MLKQTGHLMVYLKAHLPISPFHTHIKLALINVKVMEKASYLIKKTKQPNYIKMPKQKSN